MDYDCIIEVLIIGDSAVGKTNLLTRYTEDRFDEASRPTIGSDFFKQLKAINDHSVLVKFWDTAGQEKYRSLSVKFYENAHGVLIAYDTTRRETFEKVDFWLQEVRNNCRRPVKLMLVGNKTDLISEKKVSTEEAKLYAMHNDMVFWETSAKTNQNGCVNQAFDALINETSRVLLTKERENEIKERNSVRGSIIRINTADIRQDKKCCLS